MRWCLGGICVLAATGCVEHRATVTTTNDSHLTPLGAYKTVHVVYPWPGRATVRDPLAADMPITVLYWDAQGQLYRADARPRSPLAWWQRFPCDIATDALWPGTLVSQRAVTVSPQPISPWTSDTLTAQARAFGYGLDSDQGKEQAPPNPEAAKEGQ